MSSQSINETLLAMGKETLVCEPEDNADRIGLLWSSGNPLHVPSSLLFFQLTIIFLLSSLVHYILKPLNQLALVSQLMAGIILGPSILGRNKSLGGDIFPNRGVAIIETLTTFGVMCFLFITGVKMDPSIMFHPGRRAIIIGASMCFFSMLITVGLAMIMVSHLPMEVSLTKSLPYIASAQSLTGFPVISCLLSELRLLNTELSRLAIPAAMFYDVIGIIWSAIGTALAENKGGHPVNSVLALLSMLALLLTLTYLVKPIITWMIKKTPPGKPMGENYLVVVFCILFLTGFMSETIGQHYVLGPLFLGLIVPDGPPLGSALESKMEMIVSGLIYPAFISVTGLQTDLFEIRLQTLWIVALVVIISCIAKFLSVMLSALYCQVPLRESIVLAFTLNTKGIIELILFNLWRNSELLSNEEFTLCVLSLLLVTALTAPMVKVLYHPSRRYIAVKRCTIQHARLDSELRILICIHSQESIPMIMNMLEVSYASQESPITVLGLVMVDLVGRTTPALVCHNGQEQQWSLEHTTSTSAHILNAFRNYEHDNEGFAAVRTFTAISEFQFMDGEICQVAVDERTNIIIVPFHKQWDVDGSVGAVKPAIRTMNLHLLESSPCSVGILIDRSVVRGTLPVLASQTPFDVGVIFIGGPDDTEALAFGSRMAKHEFATVMVIRFLLFGSENTKDRRHDTDLIYQYRHANMGNERFEYVEEVVRDGVALSAYIRDMASRFDLILVGRQHQVSPIFQGLEQWSECQELGVIPDMLAAPDFECTASVLVIQQQRIGGTMMGHAMPTQQPPPTMGNTRESFVTSNDSSWSISIEKPVKV